MSKSIIDYILARASEPSSYAGLAGVFTALHLAVSADDLKAVTAALVAVSGLVGIILKEKNIA